MINHCADGVAFYKVAIAPADSDILRYLDPATMLKTVKSVGKIATLEKNAAPALYYCNGPGLWWSHLESGVLSSQATQYIVSEYITCFCIYTIMYHFCLRCMPCIRFDALLQGLGI